MKRNIESDFTTKPEDLNRLSNAFEAMDNDESVVKAFDILDRADISLKKVAKASLIVSGLSLIVSITAVVIGGRK